MTFTLSLLRIDFHVNEDLPVGQVVVRQVTRTHFVVAACSMIDAQQQSDAVTSFLATLAVAPACRCAVSSNPLTKTPNERIAG